MTDLFLIAHKVHGALAFDIAHHLPCPECSAMGCLECDDLGYWWIVPTSGHRAYPHTAHRLNKVFELGPGLTESWKWNIEKNIDESWSRLPDHYATRTEPSAPSLLSRLNLKPIPQPPIARRF